MRIDYLFNFLKLKLTFIFPCALQHLLRVVPVVGVLSDRQAFKPVLNAAEVEAIFDAPLEMFLKVSLRCFMSYINLFFTSIETTFVLGMGGCITCPSYSAKCNKVLQVMVVLLKSSYPRVIRENNSDPS